MNAAVVPSTDDRPQSFPWGAALHLGLGLLRLPPDRFWSLSLGELAAMGGSSRSADAMDRGALAALMRRWPDRRAD